MESLRTASQWQNPTIQALPPADKASDRKETVRELKNGLPEPVDAFRMIGPEGAALPVAQEQGESQERGLKDAPTRWLSGRLEALKGRMGGFSPEQLTQALKQRLGHHPSQLPGIKPEANASGKPPSVMKPEAGLQTASQPESIQSIYPSVLPEWADLPAGVGDASQQAAGHQSKWLAALKAKLKPDKPNTPSTPGKPQKPGEPVPSQTPKPGKPGVPQKPPLQKIPHDTVRKWFPYYKMPKWPRNCPKPDEIRVNPARIMEERWEQEVMLLPWDDENLLDPYGDTKDLIN